MKRCFAILCVACVFILGVVFSAKPIILSLSKKQLASIFAQSLVSIKGCAVQPARKITLLDIQIKRQGVYDIQIKEAVVQYSLLSLLKTSPLRLSLRNVEVSLHAPKQKISGLGDYLNLRQGGPPVFRSIEVSGLDLDLNTSQLSLKANVSLGVDLLTQSLDHLDLKIDSFNMFGLRLENASCKMAAGANQGNLNVAALKYDKLSVADIKARTRLQGALLSLYDFSARALDAELQGNMDVKLDKEVWYKVNLKVAGLNTERFVHDFEFADKFDMTGRLSGELNLEGKGSQIEILGGGFSTLDPGGRLVIKDAKFLENMARQTRSPTDLLVESFKDYHYTTGVISLSLEKADVVLKVALEGEAGARNLNVVLHDFTLKGGGK